MEVEPKYIFLPRFSFAMFAMACFYFVSSWPFGLRVPISSDFPSCVAARSDFENFAVGAVSQRRLSTVFVTWLNVNLLLCLCFIGARLLLNSTVEERIRETGFLTMESHSEGELG